MGLELIEQLNTAVRLLQNDELVVIPTETVYGLAANAFSEKAIAKIYATKNRPATNPLIVHIPHLDALANIAKDIPVGAYLLAQHFWPGPLTMILPKQDTISKMVTAGKETVAVRIPKHEVTLALLQRLDFPLVAPSANRSNHISPTTPQHVHHSLGDQTPFILNGGPCEKGIESTIIGFEENKAILYRLGALEKEAIEQVLGYPLIIKNKSEEPLAPGMFKKHYSPQTPFFVTDQLEYHIAANEGKQMGILYFSKRLFPDVNGPYRILSPEGSLDQVAENLYAYMHELDALGLDVIIAERLPNIGLGISINDRLDRASASV